VFIVFLTKEIDMKKLLLISLALLFVSSTAFAQAGAIGLFVDNPGFVDCTADDIAPALIPIYVVHHLTPGATASQFMVVQMAGFNCTYTGEIIHVPVSIGSTLTGISVSYGGCMPAPILIATINWFCMGTSPTCSYLEVVPDVAAPTGTIEVVDCAFTKLIGTGGVVNFNNDGSCDCYDPVRNTSWGGVKALYH
jgi:hypothetical protein